MSIEFTAEKSIILISFLVFHAPTSVAELCDCGLFAVFRELSRCSRPVAHPSLFYGFVSKASYKAGILSFELYFLDPRLPSFGLYDPSFCLGTCSSRFIRTVPEGWVMSCSLKITFFAEFLRQVSIVFHIPYSLLPFLKASQTYWV